MSFLLQPTNSRESQYPNAQDHNMLGFDRDADRWKVEASGINIYASGISVELDYTNDSVAIWSASGTTDIPVYLTSDLDYNNDSVAILTASGTTDIPVYVTSPIEVEVDIGDSIKVLSASGTNSIPTYMDGSLPGGDNNIGNVDVLTMPEVEVTDVSNSIPKHDYRALTYTDGVVTSIVYKTGGSGGTTVATRTLTYNADKTIATDTVV